ncbi:MAG: glutaminyl-tRNA synthase (glutamine-hydrolyzing) subunit A [Chloroflexi bacterium RBG_13_68_17]|nr:MAG: glutaminyl-tRNA synthase (glutamine-hydrolyzing) subunit A [Chloroflexi bacterium RBG_13_68_17]
MSAALCDLPAREQARRVRAGETSAVDVLESTLERISRVEGRPPALGPRPAEPDDRRHVHAYLTLTAERARRQAEAVDRAVRAGRDPGPLAGVPVAVKDIFCVQGTPSTAGSRILASFVAPYTATPVERLEAAGAVIVGKANLDEFTFGSSNESTAFLPPPGNPWDPSRVPGGSSGGSAAAVAAGEAALSLGTDTAGSIRQPAAFCGVVGVKPTYGRVSRYGLIAFASSLDCPGPIARDIADAALMLNVIAGPDPRDATAAQVPVPDYTAGLESGVRGLRIGLSPDYFRLQYPDPETGELREQPIAPEIEAAVRHAAQVLAEAGAEIVEGVPMSNTRFGIPAYFVISRVEAASNLHRYDGVKYGYRDPGPAAEMGELYRRSRGQGFGLQPKLRILMGMYVSAEQYEQGYYPRALRVRTLIRRDFEAAFDPGGAYRLDCLLTPTTPTTAFELGAVYGDSVLMQYADLLTVPADHAGIPGLSIPGGLDGRGLPIGIQLLGPDFSEARLFRIGRAFETATEPEAWRHARPVVLQGGAQ